MIERLAEPFNSLDGQDICLCIIGAVCANQLVLRAGWQWQIAGAAEELGDRQALVSATAVVCYLVNAKHAVACEVDESPCLAVDRR